MLRDKVRTHLRLWNYPLWISNDIYIKPSDWCGYAPLLRTLPGVLPSNGHLFRGPHSLVHPLSCWKDSGLWMRQRLLWKVTVHWLFACPGLTCQGKQVCCSSLHTPAIWQPEWTKKKRFHSILLLSLPSQLGSSAPSACHINHLDRWLDS